jgi:hypothetical protein
MRSRKSATPAELLDQVRDAQHAHAVAVTEANARLIEVHENIYDEAHARQDVIAEQVRLLRAEAQGLDDVKAAAQASSVAGA